MWSHGFIAQKWPHIVKVMPFFIIKAFFKQLKKILWVVPILVYPYLLTLKKKPRLLLYSRNLFPKSQVKILKIWAWMLRYQLLRQGAFVLCKEASFSFFIRVRVRVRVHAAHWHQGILYMWSHGFTAQKWPHIAEVMTFFVKLQFKILSQNSHRNLKVQRWTFRFQCHLKMAKYSCHGKKT